MKIPTVSIEVYINTDVNFCGYRRSALSSVRINLPFTFFFFFQVKDSLLALKKKYTGNRNLHVFVYSNSDVAAEDAAVDDSILLTEPKI